MAEAGGSGVKGRTALSLAALLLLACRGKAPEPPFDWRSDWAVDESLSLAVDTAGYRFPTALAFVPEPGPRPEDPLYFVTEVQGTVKAVTRSRTVHTFAQGFFRLQPAGTLPDPAGEVGLAGLCLDPEHGYLFVTFASQDPDGVLRNHIVRFQSTPGTFSLLPESHRVLTGIFAGSEAAVSHQIGPCQVDGESLYVGVGDGRQTNHSLHVDSVLGKILRMTLDGRPVPSNPFYREGEPGRAAGYVWAYGLRNPFSLEVVDGRVFAADNGSGIDRFLEIRRGESYLWDGHDWSIASRADAVLVPSVGPVQMEHAASGFTAFPQRLRNLFFVALSAPRSAGILAIPYGLAEGRMLARSRYLVRYRGTGHQAVAALALGDDGLYFAPLLPNRAGLSPVIRAADSPGRPHPFSLADLEDPEILLQEGGCLSCHTRNGLGGAAGPPLDRDPLLARLSSRLASPEYARRIAEVDRLEREPFVHYREARRQVLKAEGHARVRTWIKFHVMEPRFDNPHSQMPNLGIPEPRAEAIAGYLAGPEETAQEGGIGALLRRLLPERPWRRHLALFFGYGFLAGSGCAVLGWTAVRSVKRRSGS
ncbi:MAG TPA: PQQ-dependent sugar dehydrogenase [Thermoanaerobaculia bacterium]|nr:PQQ-dependent sugar dehydrogenase [Thermoanaerobaculia bacterium]